MAKSPASPDLMSVRLRWSCPDYWAAAACPVPTSATVAVHGRDISCQFQWSLRAPSTFNIWLIFWEAAATVEATELAAEASFPPVAHLPLYGQMAIKCVSLDWKPPVSQQPASSAATSELVIWGEEMSLEEVPDHFWFFFPHKMTRNTFKVSFREKKKKS